MRKTRKTKKVRPKKIKKKFKIIPPWGWRKQKEPEQQLAEPYPTRLKRELVEEQVLSGS